MKNLLNIAFVLLIWNVSLNANSNSSLLFGSPVDLETQVLSMLGDINFSIKDDTSVKVDFYINDYKEIVIVDIDSKNSIIQNFVKNRVDQEAVYGNDFQINMIYSLQIKFMANENVLK